MPALSTPRLLPLAGLVALVPLLAPAAARAQSKEQCIADNEGGQDLRAARKLRAARVKLAACEAPSCPEPVRQDCARRVDEIDAATPSIVFEAKDAAGQDVSAVSVTMDGEPLAAQLDGRAILVDPGEHTFAFESAGAAHVARTLVINEGEKERHEVVSLVSAGAPAPETPSGGHTQRLAGIALGGAGLAGLVVGAVFGVMAKSTYDGATSQCVGGTGGSCGQSGHDQSDTALSQALVSTVAFVAGGVLAAGGVVLYLTAPRDQSVSVSVIPRPGGGTMAIGATF